jgi:putative transposase
MTRRQSTPPRDRLKPVGAEFIHTRRWLPHWQQGGATYFITFRTVTLELSGELRELVLRAVCHFNDQRYVLWAAVVMPDHVHVLLTPLERRVGRWWSLSSIMHSLKAYTAKQVNARLQRSGIVWMQESFDRIVRNDDELIEKWQYIRNNPVKRGLCARVEEWDAFYERAAEWPPDGTG